MAGGKQYSLVVPNLTWAYWYLGEFPEALRQVTRTYGRRLWCSASWGAIFLLLIALSHHRPISIPVLFSPQLLSPRRNVRTPRNYFGILTKSSFAHIAIKRTRRTKQISTICYLFSGFCFWLVAPASLSIRACSVFTSRFIARLLLTTIWIQSTAPQDSWSVTFH